MDPISALGVISSSVGIASFALDLSVGLFRLAKQFHLAKDSLKGAGETVKSTAYALEEIEQLLWKEAQHVRTGNQLVMFSSKGLARIKDITDRCLIVLWKIEAVAVGCEEPDEEDCGARLAARARASGEPQIMLDRRVTAPEPGIWDRLIYVTSTADKLKEYGEQLLNSQISLGLILDVVIVNYLGTKSFLTEDDRRTIDTAKEDLHRPRPNYRQVAQDVLCGTSCDDTDSKTSVQHPRRANGTGSSLGTSKLFAVRPGLESSPRPHIKQLFKRRSSPSTTLPSISTETRDIGSVQSIGSDAERSLSRSIANAEPPETSEAQGQSTPSYLSTTTIHMSNSDYSHTTTPAMSERSSAQTASLRRGVSYNPLKVFSLQKHGDWRHEKLSHADILQRLANLDLDPLGALDKKLELPIKHQARVDAIHMKVNCEETNRADYERTLRQLEVKNKKLGRVSLGSSWGLLAIIVYLEREAQQLRCDQDNGPHRTTSQSPATEGPEALDVDDDPRHEQQREEPSQMTLERFRELKIKFVERPQYQSMCHSITHIPTYRIDLSQLDQKAASEKPSRRSARELPSYEYTSMVRDSSSDAANDRFRPHSLIPQKQRPIEGVKFSRDHSQPPTSASDTLGQGSPKVRPALGDTVLTGTMGDVRGPAIAAQAGLGRDLADEEISELGDSNWTITDVPGIASSRNKVDPSSSLAGYGPDDYNSRITSQALRDPSSTNNNSRMLLRRVGQFESSPMPTSASMAQEEETIPPAPNSSQKPNTDPEMAGGHAQSSAFDCPSSSPLSTYPKKDSHPEYAAQHPDSRKFPSVNISTDNAQVARGPDAGQQAEARNHNLKRAALLEEEDRIDERRLRKKSRSVYKKTADTTRTGMMVKATSIFEGQGSNPRRRARPGGPGSELAVRMAVSESKLDDDLIAQLTLLLTPARPGAHGEQELAAV